MKRHCEAHLPVEAEAQQEGSPQESGSSASLNSSSLELGSTLFGTVLTIMRVTSFASDIIRGIVQFASS